MRGYGIGSDQLFNGKSFAFQYQAGAIGGHYVKIDAFNLFVGMVRNGYFGCGCVAVVGLCIPPFYLVDTDGIVKKLVIAGGI